MLRIFDFVMRLYPAEYRAEFGGEMRAVFPALAGERARGRWFWWNEYRGLLQGAAEERCRQFAERAPSIAGGALFATGMQLVV